MTTKHSAAFCMGRQAIHRHDALVARESQSPEEKEFCAAVARMTNRQRKAWAGAGYPGLRQRDPARMGHHYRRPA
jgi:hypothetical protein